MHTFELVIVLDCDLKTTEIEFILSYINDLIAIDGFVRRWEWWGKRRLAYEIKGCQYGYYVLVIFDAVKEYQGELSKKVNAIPGVLRHLISLVDPQKVPEIDIQSVRTIRKQIRLKDTDNAQSRNLQQNRYSQTKGKDTFSNIYGKNGVMTAEVSSAGSVAMVTKFLQALNSTYRELSLLERILVEANNIPVPVLEQPEPWESNDTNEIIGIIQDLGILRVEIHSPGFWEFAGSLFPLETIRKYLQDRHERRKDLSYRETLEKDRLELENKRIALSLIREELIMLKEMGYSEQNINEVIAPRICDSLVELENQSRNYITHMIVSESEPPETSHEIIG